MLDCFVPCSVQWQLLRDWVLMLFQPVVAAVTANCSMAFCKANVYSLCFDHLPL